LLKIIGLLQRHSNIRTEGMIMEDSSIDKVEMLAEMHEDIEMEDQDASNDDSNQQRVLIDFQEVIHEDGTTMTQEILEAEEVDSENINVHTGAGIQVMEIDDSRQEMSEVVDTVVMGKVEEPDMEVSQSDPLPRIEITEVIENEDDTQKTEPDTEAVSEDELPSETAAKVIIVFLHFA